ncbi:SUGAR TRANSPORTER ERD6-LIKE 7 [Salix viminalis]|uniref:SUGAR TRANSPORTER ERD6-LIKE 7 n=1 Tax=Salix viminalis TaxID=40686 RepID=A0A9Q0ZCS1_SALVM|nr:SUGAR TRANSPORTER ERD6-LIKE 7 [Salix viminalis]
MSIKDDLEREEVREPLMDKKNLSDEQGGSFVQSRSKESAWMVYLSTFVAVCGSFAFGSCAGYSSPTENAIRDDLSLSLAEYSVFGSILTFGAMIGAITSGPIADLIGRKGALRVAASFCVAGWLAIYFAQGVLALDLGRLATGYGMGIFSYVVPVFIAEISPKNLRGALTTTNQLMICGGVSVAFIIGTVLTWRALALTGIVPYGWQREDVKKSFKQLYKSFVARKADISQEATEIKEYIETLEQLPKARFVELFQRRYLRSIGVGLMVFQQFGGINGVCFYVSNIFESAGFSPSLGTIIYAILQVVVTALNTTVIDKAGRKPLLLVSASGLVLGCIITGISFYLKVNELAIKSVPALTLTGILLYIGSFSAGMGAVPWVIMSEIFPINIKGVAGSLATLVNWFGAWAISYTYNYLMSWSSYGTFILYAAINALAIVFVVTVVPETKGRTLEQIQAAINA